MDDSTLAVERAAHRRLRRGIRAPRRAAEASAGADVHRTPLHLRELRLVDNCTAYHVVETKHGQPHVYQDPIFTPREGSPTVAVNIFPPDSEHKARGFEIELDVVECADFAREMGKWRKMMPPGTLVKAGFDPDYEPP